MEEMKSRSLYKYYRHRRRAESFLRESCSSGSLAYYRDYEDAKVRGDRNEGTARYTPENGLVLNNLTQGTTMTVSGHSFTATANQGRDFRLLP
jgi:hypothetical protein